MRLNIKIYLLSNQRKSLSFNSHVRRIYFKMPHYKNVEKFVLFVLVVINVLLYSISFNFSKFIKMKLNKNIKFTNIK